MKILVTGGTGFLGVPCVEMLCQRGHSLLALSRNPKPCTKLEGVDWLCADLGIPSTYEGAVGDFKPDALLHLAWEGIPDFSLQNSLRNLQYGTLLAGYAIRQGCRHVVVSGSCWEYGRVVGRVQESSQPVEPGVFGASKNAQMLLLGALAREAGASLAWARVFFPYGPGQKASSLVPTICRALQSGEVPTLRSPYAKNDFLYLDDAARALLVLLEHGADGIFNVGSGEATAAGRVADILLQAAGGAPLSAGPVPDVETGFFADIAAMERLGWSPEVTLDEGLSRTWRWFGETSAVCG